MSRLAYLFGSIIRVSYIAETQDGQVLIIRSASLLLKRFGLFGNIRFAMLTNMYTNICTAIIIITTCLNVNINAI
ncbi:hypothetical protein FHT21_000781 [Pedobacter sp. SG908]|nr:hypothetical protein [Pedobacter sp. SG908]